MIFATKLHTSVCAELSWAADEKCKIIRNQNSNKFCIGDPPFAHSSSSTTLFWDLQFWCKRCRQHQPPKRVTTHSKLGLFLAQLQCTLQLGCGQRCTVGQHVKNLLVEQNVIFRKFQKWSCLGLFLKKKKPKAYLTDFRILPQCARSLGPSKLHDLCSTSF